MKQLWGKVDNINANNIISVDHNETINIGNIEIKALLRDTLTIILLGSTKIIFLRVTLLVQKSMMDQYYLHVPLLILI